MARRAAERRQSRRLTPAAPPLRPIERRRSEVTDAAANEMARAARAVAQETREAAAQTSLDPADPRWVLATRVASQLEGSLLRPERRARVMRTAAALGIRSFDAGLIIAMVQDAARRGGDVGDVAPALRMVQPPARRRLPRSRWMMPVAAVLTAATVVLILVRWVLVVE